MALPLPTRTLPPSLDLEQLKRQAKELLNAFRAGETTAIADVHRFYRDADPATFALHLIVTMGHHVTAAERVAFATAALDAGARLDLRDDLLKSTPLGWACRWGREELVRLFLERGADPLEADAEPWATPLAWAEKKGRPDLVALLREHSRS